MMATSNASPELEAGRAVSLMTKSDQTSPKMKTTLLLTLMLSRSEPTAVTLLLAFGLAADAIAARAADLRLGIIGTDTSHVNAFTELLNDPAAKDHVPGAKIVAAFKGGSPDIPASINRVEAYGARLQQKYGVKICDTIEQLCPEVDGVLIESVDGRPHLAQAKVVIAAKKPLFIDKPLAGSLPDALEIIRLAKDAGVPMFTSSSLRFGKNTQAVRQGSLGKVLSAETSSPAHLEPHHPDLYWYGIHGCESLFAVMGTGCQSVVRRTSADGMIEVVGTWKGGRTGVFRERKSYGGKARGEKGEGPIGTNDGYAALVAEIVKFFQTGKSPVPVEETVELFAFMTAADESKRLDGKPVTLAEVLATARGHTPARP